MAAPMEWPALYLQQALRPTARPGASSQFVLPRTTPTTASQATARRVALEQDTLQVIVW
jgi:hypothetical protein